MLVSASAIAVVLAVALGLRSPDAPSGAGHEIPELEGVAEGELDPRFSAAVAETVSAIRREPQRGALYGRLGTIYHAHKYYGAARRAYEIAAELEPENADWPYYVALLASGRGENELARASLRRVLELEPDDRAARLRLANLLLQDGDLEAAEELYAELSGAAPREPWGWVGRAKVKQREGDLDEAVRLLETAVENAPEDREGSYLLAMLYRQLGEAEKSAALLEEIEKRVRAWPPDPRMERIQQGRLDLQALIEEANRRLDEGDVATAEALYGEVLSSEPEHFDALFNLGVLYGQTGRYEQAEEVLRAAVRSKPTDAQAHYVLAMAYASQRRFEEAGVELERVLELDPDHAEAGAVLESATR